MVETVTSRDQLFLNACPRAFDPEAHGAQEIFIGVKSTDKGGLDSQGILIFPEGQPDDAAVSRFNFNADHRPPGTVGFNGDGAFAL